MVGPEPPAPAPELPISVTALSPRRVDGPSSRARSSSAGGGGRSGVDEIAGESSAMSMERLRLWLARMAGAEDAADEGVASSGERAEPGERRRSTRATTGAAAGAAAGSGFVGAICARFAGAGIVADEPPFFSGSAGR